MLLSNSDFDGLYGKYLEFRVMISEWNVRPWSDLTYDDIDQMRDKHLEMIDSCGFTPEMCEKYALSDALAKKLELFTTFLEISANIKGDPDAFDGQRFWRQLCDLVDADISENAIGLTLGGFFDAIVTGDDLVDLEKLENVYQLVEATLEQYAEAI